MYSAASRGNSLYSTILSMATILCSNETNLRTTKRRSPDTVPAKDKAKPAEAALTPLIKHTTAVIPTTALERRLKRADIQRLSVQYQMKDDMLLSEIFIIRRNMLILAP